MPKREGVEYHVYEARVDLKHVPGLLRNDNPEMAMQCVQRAREHLDEIEETVEGSA